MAIKSESRSVAARAVAARTLARVLGERRKLALDDPDLLRAGADARARAFVQELCYGVLRRYYSLDATLNALLTRKMKPRDADVKALALIGLYQLAHSRTPPYAAVAATVESCDALGKPWAKGLLNALMRRYQRERAAGISHGADDQQARYDHPEWLLKLLQEEFADDWTDIVAANNQPPPMILRVNLAVTRRETYMQRLAAAGIAAEATAFSRCGVVLKRPVDVDALPGFAQGEVSVQDLAAQLAAPLLAPGSGQRILDACAAPGSKLAHLLEYAPAAEVVALERCPRRCALAQSGLERLGLKARLINDDALAPASWWDGRRFDKILLDAPCSATGVIRRHADIKYLRTPEEVQKSALLQTELLNATWPLLRKDGELLYITCSVLSLENDERISDFTERHEDAEVVPIEAGWGKALRFGRQTVPGEKGMDGFYYARLRKV